MLHTDATVRMRRCEFLLSPYFTHYTSEHRYGNDLPTKEDYALLGEGQVRRGAAVKFE